MIEVYKIKVNTRFYLCSRDFQLNLKTSYDVQVPNSNTVADFQTRLFKMMKLSGSAYFADFYRAGFYAGDKLKAGDRIDNGSVVFAVISCKRKLEKVRYDINRKDTHDRFSKVFVPKDK